MENTETKTIMEEWAKQGLPYVYDVRLDAFRLATQADINRYEKFFRLFGFMLEPLFSPQFKEAQDEWRAYNNPPPTEEF
jgi:hypothetical protein